MAEVQGALNPEPADPQERAEHDLPPKSYADAAQEAIDSSQAENGHDYGKSNGSERNGKITVNAGTEDPKKRVVFERYSNGNGSVLTSVRPDPNYEELLKHDRQVAPRESAKPSKPPSKRQDIPKSQLKSGRKAGAGWQQSAYVISQPAYRLLLTLSESDGLLSMFLFNDGSKLLPYFGILPRSLCSFRSSFFLLQFHYSGLYLYHT